METMNDPDTTITWVHPGRITNVENLPGGQYRVTIDSTTIAFAARNLKEEQAVARDVELSARISHDDTDCVIHIADFESLQDYLRVGAPVMVEIDADDDDEWVIHLYPDALFQETALPEELYLLCPADGRGRWFSKVDGSAYRCPCGVLWDVHPDQDEE